MTTTNRGSRQSEYQRSIAGAGNVRSGGDERYGGGSSGTSRESHGVGGEGSRGYGQDEFSRSGSRVEEGMERVSQRVSDTYGQVADQLGETYDDLRQQGRRALNSTGKRVRTTARAAQDYFEANPLMIGAVGLGIGHWPPTPQHLSQGAGDLRADRRELARISRPPRCGGDAASGPWG